MRIEQTHKMAKAGGLIPLLVLCLASADLTAQNSPAANSVLDNETLDLMSYDAQGSVSEPGSYTLLPEPDSQLDFDLGGSDTRKLELQLGQPLSLHTGTSARVMDSGSNLLGLDATLAAPISQNFTLAGSVNKQLGQARFQSLGSIQCMNGVLRADSYTASGCRFVNEPFGTSEQQQISLGAYLDFDNASASVDWFTRDSQVNQSNARGVNPLGSRAMMSNSLLSPNLGNPLLASPGADPMQYLNSEASGVNLNFKVGFATDTRGDIQLGLAFSRVLEANYQGAFYSGSESLSWTIAEPFNSAKMNLEWSRGSFSSGIQGYYRDSVNFLNRNSMDNLTTFDVHFTWRTPWKANLSVGATNVLNAGADSVSVTESQPVDPLESIYGRIPYVRYKQDL